MKLFNKVFFVFSLSLLSYSLAFAYPQIDTKAMKQVQKIQLENDATFSMSKDKFSKIFNRGLYYDNQSKVFYTKDKKPLNCSDFIGNIYTPLFDLKVAQIQAKYESCVKAGDRCAMVKIANPMTLEFIMEDQSKTTLNCKNKQ